jgi:hypothetical protein
MFFLLILGLKLLVTNLKSIGNIAKYTLLAIWIIAVGILISLGINELTQISSEAKDVKKEVINITLNDTLQVSFKNNDFYDKDVNKHTDFRLTQDENNRDVIYSNNVTIKVLHTNEKLPYLQVEKLAVGKSPDEAKKRAEKIKYSYTIEGSKLILDNYLLSEVASKYRNQKVELFLYLPTGILFKTAINVENYDNSDDDYFNMHYSSDNYIYKVSETKIKCLNCPIDENEHNDVDSNVIIKGEGVIDLTDSTKNISIKANGKEIIQTTTGKDKPGKLTLNKEGIIIKTK